MNTKKLDIRIIEQLALRDSMSEQDWKAYCQRMLFRLLEENKTMLKRMKNN